MWLRALLQGGWTGVLAAARYGHPETLRELIREFDCNRNAVKPVSHIRMYERQLCCIIICLNVLPSDIYILVSCVRLHNYNSL